MANQLLPNAGRGLLLVFLAVLPVLFSTATLEHFEYPKSMWLRLAALASLALALMGLPSWRWHRPNWNCLDVGVICLALSAGASTVFSISPRVSWWGEHTSYAGLTTILGYVILYFTARSLADSIETMQRLLLACLLGAAVAAGIACLQFVGVDPIGWTFSSNAGDYLRPFGTLGHPNHLGALLAMLLPIVVYGATVAASRRQHVGMLLLGLVLLAGLLITLARAAWLGCLAGMGMGLLLWLRQRRGPFRMTTLIGAAMLTLLVLTLVLWWNPRDIRSGLADRFANQHSARTRLIIWQGSLAVWQERPIFGVGPDAFQLAFAPHRTADFWDHEWDAVPTHPHNEILHVLATQGVVGLLALIVFLIGFVQACSRALRHEEAQIRQFGIALMAGSAAFFVLSLFSFTAIGYGPVFVVLAAFLGRLPSVKPGLADAWFRPALLIAATSIFALLLWESSHSRAIAASRLWTGLAVVGALLTAAVWLFQQWNKSTQAAAVAPASTGFPWWPLIVTSGVGVGVGVLYLVVLPWQAHLACARGERRLTHDPAEARQQLERSVALDPAWDHYWTKLAQAHQHVAASADDTDQRQRSLLRAKAIWDQLIERSPRHGTHHVNRGLCLLTLCANGWADPIEMYASFDAALDCDPSNPLHATDAAQAALRLGDLPRARRYADAGLRHNARYGPLFGQLGYLELQAGDDAEACEHLQQSLELRWDANHGSWKDATAVNLLVAYSRTGHDQKVESLALQLLDRHPTSTEVRSLLEDARTRLRR